MIWEPITVPYQNSRPEVGLVVDFLDFHFQFYNIFAKNVNSLCTYEHACVVCLDPCSLLIHVSSHFWNIDS